MEESAYVKSPPTRYALRRDSLRACSLAGFMASANALAEPELAEGERRLVAGGGFEPPTFGL